MKITLVSLALACALAPIASQASDKEVTKSHHACYCKHHPQVALFVSGRGIGQTNTTPRLQSVTEAQTGEGPSSLTFFTGR